MTQGPLQGVSQVLAQKAWSPTCTRALLRQHPFQSHHVVRTQPFQVRGFLSNRYCSHCGIFEKQVLAVVFGGVKHLEPILVAVISKQVLETPKATPMSGLTDNRGGPKEQALQGAKSFCRNHLLHY